MNAVGDLKKGIAFWSLIFFALALPLSAEKAKGEKLAAALSELGVLEKALPAEREPGASMDESEKKKRSEAFFAAGRKCHDIMGEFSEPLGKKADRYLRASLAYREFPVARAYLGSSHLIAGRDAKIVFAKLAEVDIGLKEVDAAVKSSPEDILTRVIRVECCIGLPSMFKRLDTVTEDLAILLKACAADQRAFEGIYPPARLFGLKADELEQRGKNSMAAKYREKAKELAGQGGAR
jgi:hypothetical protein